MRSHNYKRKLIGGHYHPDYSRTAKAWLTLFLGVVILGGGSYQQWVDGQPLVDPKVRILEVETVEAYEEQVEIIAFHDPQPKARKKTQKEQIIDYIYEVFGEHGDDALKVLECENKSLNPNAVNYNRNGTVDRGIFQLNSAYWGGEENFNWKTNIDKARVIFNRAGETWRPWTCSHKVGQKNYLGE